MALVLHPTQERVILHGISWGTFERLLTDRGDRPGVLFAYDQGTVELTMPSSEHEMLGTFHERSKVVDSLPGYNSGIAGCRHNLTT